MRSPDMTPLARLLGHQAGTLLSSRLFATWLTEIFSIVWKPPPMTVTPGLVTAISVAGCGVIEGEDKGCGVGTGVAVAFPVLARVAPAVAVGTTVFVVVAVGTGVCVTVGVRVAVDVGVLMGSSVAVDTAVSGMSAPALATADVWKGWKFGHAFVRSSF